MWIIIQVLLMLIKAWSIKNAIAKMAWFVSYVFIYVYKH